MSVWVRKSGTTLRLDLLARWGRPPVLAPHAGVLKTLVREAAAGSIPAADSGSVPGDGDGRIEAIERALGRSAEAPEFRRRAAEANHVRLVIPDATRRGPWQAWVSPCARWLEAISPKAMSRLIMVATGVHKPSLPEQLNIPAGWSAIVNGHEGYADHQLVGTTHNGTPVRLHPSWVRGDLKIALGDVSFHYLAGFGGGRKLVFPGLGEPAGILANHRLSIDPHGRFHPTCAPGVVDGNPVHADLLEAAGFSPPDLLVQQYEPRPGEGAVLEVGDWDHLHERACRAYRDGHGLSHTRRPEILIADAGGRPRDATFLQAHKSLQHAARFLPDGGRLLLVAGLEEGSGSATLERLWGWDRESLSRRALEAYELHTHTALALRGVLDRISVAVWSTMDREQLRMTGMEPLSSEEEALRWLERKGTPRDWGWLTRAEEVLPRLSGEMVPTGEEKP